MKKFISLIFILIGFFTMNSISALNVQDVIQDGIYSGRLTRVYMNGEKSPYGPLDVELTVNADSTINLYMPKFKIGKMPGSIAINATNIKVVNGSFEQLVGNSILFQLLNSKEKKFDAQIKGNLSKSQLTFSVNSVNATYLGVPFDARITFEGNK